MKKQFNYLCRGFTFKYENDYLLGVVGDTHSINGWLDVVFRSKSEKAKEYFSDCSDKEIINYLLNNYGIRLERNH